MTLVKIIEQEYLKRYDVGTCEADIIKMLKGFSKEQIATFDIEYFCDWLWENN